MAKKKWENISKAGMLIFMILIVLGFMLPGFLDVGDGENQKTIEPRLCNQDSDCYLTCEDLPIKVLCIKNLCQQNNCDEYVQYPYADFLSFSLTIKAEGEEIELKERINPADLFVKFSEEEIKIYSPKLKIGDVLEKLNIDFNGKCMVIDSKNYCQSEGLDLEFLVNGEKSYAYENYQPKKGDLIEIVYS